MSKISKNAPATPPPSAQRPRVRPGFLNGSPVLELFLRLVRKALTTEQAVAKSPIIGPVRATPPRPGRNPFAISRLRSILASLQKGENKYFDSPRFDRVKFTIPLNQQLTAVCFSALLAVSLTLGHAQAQDAPEPAQQAGQAVPESPAQAQAEAQSDPQTQDAPTPLPVTGDALADYLRALAQAQAARADALQAHGESLRAQQTLQQAVSIAQQAQAALSALVNARAKESAAPDGWRLGLDGKWSAPAAEAQAGP